MTASTDPHPTAHLRASPIAHLRTLRALRAAFEPNVALDDFFARKPIAASRNRRAWGGAAICRTLEGDLMDIAFPLGS